MKDLPFDPYDFFGYLATGLIVLFGSQQLIGVPHIAGQDLKSLDLVVSLLSAYVVGQLIATPAKALLEDSLTRKWLKPPSVNLMQDPSRGVRRFLFPGYIEPLSTAARGRVLAKATSEGLPPDSRGEELFVHIRFRDYVRNDSVLMARLATFLNKYAFNRNLSFASLAIGTVSVR